MKILLIAGHGAGDTGAVSQFAKEYEENRKMANLVMDRLKHYADVTMYPQERNCYKDNLNGQLQVAFNDFDYVLEFHMNQSAESRRGIGNGVEIMVHKLISGVSVEHKIAANLGKLGFAIRRDKGIYRVLGYLNMNTCYNLGVDYALAETCFLDNEHDMKIYQSNREKVADAYVAGIVDGFGLTKKIVETPNKDAVMLRSMSTEEYIEYIGKRATEDQRKNGILAALTVAQAMLECANGKSELACGLNAPRANIEANGTEYGARNLFGMKTDISKGTWESTVWDGKVYRKQTAEQRADGSYMNIWADFRSYDTIDQSIEDHAQYLANAKTPEGNLRYPGLVGEKDYRRAIDILYAGGYATSLKYKENLISRIEKYDLCRFNLPDEYKEWPAAVTGAVDLNVRKTPNGEVMNLGLDTLPRITVIGEEPDSDGDTWYKVRLSNGIVGYVWPKYIVRLG